MQDLLYEASEEATEATVWIDLASPSHPFLFASIARGLSVDCLTTVRQKTETVDLAESCDLHPTVLGRDFDNPHLRKLGIPLRTAQLAARAPAADVSLSARNAMCVLASKARGIPSIHFTDNDVTAHVDGLHVERLYNRFEAAATHTVVPAAFDQSELTTWGVDRDRIHTYDGYKEDVYVADFEPDPTFPDRLPVDNYVVIRPEALSAAYVETKRSIAPELLAGFVADGYDVVYLPRGRGDEAAAEPYDPSRVYVPDRPLDGRQLAWHASCVLTGSGTMAREAACMRKPAVSFFPNTPLSVDQELIASGRIFHSRDPDAIRTYVHKHDGDPSSGSLAPSAIVRDEVIAIVDRLLRELTGSTGGVNGA